MKSTREGKESTHEERGGTVVRALLCLARGGVTLARAPYALVTRKKCYSFHYPVLYMYKIAILLPKVS